jgi:hypothetical protein
MSIGMASPHRRGGSDWQMEMAESIRRRRMLDRYASGRGAYARR